MEDALAVAKSQTEDAQRRVGDLQRQVERAEQRLTDATRESAMHVRLPGLQQVRGSCPDLVCAPSTPTE